MRSSEFESSAPIEIESTKLAHPESALGLEEIGGPVSSNLFSQHHLLQQQQAGQRRQSRRLIRNFSIQPDLEASCVLQRRPDPQVIGPLGQGQSQTSLQDLPGGHSTQHSSGGTAPLGSGTQRRRLKTRSTSVDIFSPPPRASVAALYAYSNRYATPEHCGNCDEAWLSGDEVSVMSGSASSSCWTAGISSGCGGTHCEAATAGAGRSSSMHASGPVMAHGGARGPHTASHDGPRARRVSSTSVARRSLSNALTSPALSPSRTAKSSVRSRDTGYSEGTCRSSSSSSSSSDHSSTSGALASVSDDEDNMPENGNVFSEQQQQQQTLKPSKKVGRTKSCPVATSRPQRLLAVRDLQDLSQSTAAPLALRSRGDFMWPPTSLSPREIPQGISDIGEQVPVSLQESSMHLHEAGPSTRPLTPLASVAASPQTPSSPGVSPHGHSYCHDRNSPCTERDSMVMFIMLVSLLGPLRATFQAISECRSPQLTDRSPVSPSLKRALSTDTRSNKSSDGCSTGGTASPSRVLSTNSSMEKKSDSEEGAGGPQDSREQQEGSSSGGVSGAAVDANGGVARRGDEEDPKCGSCSGGRERKASKTSTDRESDREREQAGGREKRLSSSTPTLGVQHSLDCDFGDKLHTAKPEIDEGDYGIGPTYKKMSEAEYLSRLSIHDAARTGDLHVIKLLIRRDKKRMETVDERGWTPLHLAAANGHTDIVKYLCSEGAHIRALDPTGYTSMHVAAMNGNEPCLQVLLKMGADVDNEASDGFTPLHLATLNNHADCVKTLLAWGANMGREDALGRTIQDMVEEYNLEEVGTLLKNIWTQFEKYRKAGKASGSRKSLRKLIQLAASTVSACKDETNV
ncbi:hypothetical protein BIW11_08099 [Tropilaelaps mercedesae]|uniref:Alpha-latrotoxin n=1 Tax=Tropilaelaps mercedesae TaxID=418985 RepID=A0A1V9XR01_9ACAR|nr:hypothetical protein BIW11_08099 [Tropilaelaps mercedesae]